MIPSKHPNNEQPSNQPSDQQGFTIIESLVAILVVTILLVAISPVIVLSIGVRVQAKRVDSATQAARLYIDGVKSGEIDPPEHRVVLQETSIVTASGTTTTVFSPQRGSFAAASTPTAGTLACAASTTGSYYCANTNTSPYYSLYCVDGDDDGVNQCTADSNRDLVVQAFRSALSTTTSIESGYLMGVRVYRADGFSDSEAFTTQEQLASTGGLGDRKGPLIEATTEVITNQTNLGDYCQRFGGCQ
ncbi:MAG: hormogonium polysaccharide secretion pseudopilin HpsB [Leptolyngbyaceae cyanobacterium MO_188.B28]|nr:hormogonium polysaccharide secretion pseudopilin HpsB [Leptolyngbyaceae cyanobacterium MO_188.B28]